MVPRPCCCRRLLAASVFLRCRPGGDTEAVLVAVLGLLGLLRPSSSAMETVAEYASARMPSTGVSHSNSTPTKRPLGPGVGVEAAVQPLGMDHDLATGVANGHSHGPAAHHHAFNDCGAVLNWLTHLGPPYKSQARETQRERVTLPLQK
jgi:hypothetical protein